MHVGLLTLLIHISGSPDKCLLFLEALLVLKDEAKENSQQFLQQTYQRIFDVLRITTYSHSTCNVTTLLNYYAI